jgi:predicted transcriptional regulator
MKSVPRHEWSTARITRIIDRTAATVCGAHSMATVETALAVGHHDYIPVVDAATDQLIGILSSSDVMRARQHAQETLRTGVDAAKVTVIRRKTSFEQREDQNL